MKILFLDNLYPKCDIFGQLIAGSFQMGATALTNEANKEMTEKTNQTNLQIAQETNQTNLDIARETNALQVAESEKAYQRSTASNQIAELVKTGISEQQARQIVAGSGSPATYTPGSMQSAQMVAPTMQAPQFDAAAMGNAAAQFGGALGSFGDLAISSYTSKDGGSIGLLSAQNDIEHFSPFTSLFKPETLSSWDSIYNAVFNVEDDAFSSTPSDADYAEMRDLLNSVSQKGAPAKRAFAYYIKYNSDLAGTRFVLHNLRESASQATIKTMSDELQKQILSLTQDDLVSLTHSNMLLQQNQVSMLPYVNSMQISEAQYKRAAAKIERLNAEILDNKAPLIMNTDLLQYKNLLIDLSNTNVAKNSPQYAQMVVDTLLADTRTAYLTSIILQSDEQTIASRLGLVPGTDVVTQGASQTLREIKRIVDLSGATDVLQTIFSGANTLKNVYK